MQINKILLSERKKNNKEREKWRKKGREKERNGKLKAPC